MSRRTVVAFALLLAAAGTTAGCATSSNQKTGRRAEGGSRQSDRGHERHRELIRQRAAFEFDCEESSVEIENAEYNWGTTSGTYLVRACGTRAVYICKSSYAACRLDSTSHSQTGGSGGSGQS
ncbi:MAG: hypothetical protein ABEL76_12175 [Bradymonadaceae bacterium]